MSTSNLQKQVGKLLRERYFTFEIHENTRPDWLLGFRGERLELDFYFPEIDLAIEVQGSQHYTYSTHFHKSYEDFKHQLDRDIAKRQLCKSFDVLLIEIDSISMMKDVFQQIDTFMVGAKERKAELIEHHKRDIKIRNNLLNTRRGIENAIRMRRPERRIREIESRFTILLKWTQRNGGINLLETLTPKERKEFLRTLDVAQAHLIAYRRKEIEKSRPAWTPLYNPCDNPYRRFGTMIQRSMGKGIKYQKKTRLMITCHLTETDEIFTSSWEIPQFKIEQALDKYFPDWRVAEPIAPPKETQDLIRNLAVGYSFILVKRYELPSK